MKASEVLVKALKEVDEANVPTEFRVAAFEKAVDMVLVEAGFPAGHPQQLPGGASVGAVAERQSGSGISPLGKIAGKLKVQIEDVQDVFDHGEQGLQIIISPGKLDRQLGAATKQIALLVAAGRQAAGDDEDWTDVNEIRRICEDYKKLDPSNFAAHIKAMRDEFSSRGTRYKREVKVTRPGWDAAKELVQKLAGAEG